MNMHDPIVATERGRMFVALMLICHGTGFIVNAQEKDEQRSEPQRPQVALRTVYLAEPIGRCHQITVSGELGGAGQVTLDGNTCTITQFGDLGVCTKIAFEPVEVKIRQLRLADPTGQGRRLFQLDGKLEPADAQFFLIVPRRRSQPHRLVVDLSNDHRRVVTLEPVPPPPRKPELCQKAKYRAEQADGSCSQSLMPLTLKEAGIRVVVPGW